MGSDSSGGQTKADPSGWSVDTLRNHIESLITEIDKRYEQRFAAQEKATLVAVESARMAVNKAEAAIERRLENTNEWRQAMNDRDLKLLPRLEYDRAHIDLVQRVDEIRETFTGRMDALHQAQIRRESSSSGMGVLVGWIFGGAGLLVGVITVVIMFSSMRQQVDRNTEVRGRVMQSQQQVP